MTVLIMVVVLFPIGNKWGLSHPFKKHANLFSFKLRYSETWQR